MNVEMPEELVDSLSINNKPTIIYKAEDLSKELCKIMPDFLDDEFYVISGGGVITYALLNRYKKLKAKDIIKVNRIYSKIINGNPNIEYKIDSQIAKDKINIIDDIVSSGATIYNILKNSNTYCNNLISLMTSINIRSSDEFRWKERSTIKGVRKLFTSQLVNGFEGQKPSILSARYLMGKALEDESYLNFYLAKKLGGIEEATKIKNIVSKIDTSEIKLLREYPDKFIIKYGGN